MISSLDGNLVHPINPVKNRVQRKPTKFGQEPIIFCTVEFIRHFFVQEPTRDFCSNRGTPGT